MPGILRRYCDNLNNNIEMNHDIPSDLGSQQLQELSFSLPIPHYESGVSFVLHARCIGIHSRKTVAHNTSG